MNVRTISRRTAHIAALALAFVCAQARAAAPQLPATAIADDTFLVVNINATQLTPESMEASVKALLGANAAMAGDFLAKYKVKYDEFIAAGAEGGAVVMSGDPEAPKPDATAYVKLKAGADADAIITKIRADQAKEGKADDTDITKDGDFLVIRQKGAKAPGAASADRAKSFGDILGGSDKAVAVAFLPTDALRTKMKAELQKDPNQQPWQKALGQALSDSKWMMLDVKVGDSPTIAVTVQAADESGAKSLADGVTQGAQTLKAQAEQMKAGGAQVAPFVDALNALADALKPTQTGSKVSLSIDGKSIAPAISTLMPMILMGAGGGGAGPKP